MSDQHFSVLLAESIEFLNVQDSKWYIDATFGRGGHTREILDHGGNVIALDCDEAAVHFGMRKFVREIEEKRLQIIHENFDRVEDVIAGLNQRDTYVISGILADFGVSSPQLDDATRGFSFEKESQLDMRMDARLGVKAKDLVNALGKRELYELLTEFAQEKHARVIVEAILKARANKPIETTTELAHVIEKVVHREGRLHPATKTFMALRMLVNDELGVINRFLPQAFGLLEPHGRLVTISFHEGEDRLVKHFCKEQEAQGKGTLLTDKPVSASESESDQNPRSRSAKLRAIEKQQ